MEEIIKYILVGLSCISIIACVVSLIFLKQTRRHLYEATILNKRLKDASSYNFTQEMQFLIYLISYKCRLYQKMVLDPTSKIYNGKLLKGNDLTEALNEIVPEIYAQINDSYKEVLLKYYSEEGLKQYIIELVYDNLTDYLVGSNKKKINKFSNIMDTVNKPTSSENTKETTNQTTENDIS